MTTQKSNNTITDLRAVVVDEKLAMVDRRHAAALLVALKVELANKTPPADDAEVLKLTTPWSRATEHDSYIADLGKPFGSDGIPLEEAQAIVATRWVQRSLLTAVVDGSLCPLEKLESCRAILANLAPQNPLRHNNCSAEKLLATVTKPTDVRLYCLESGGYEWGPVQRPPMEMIDAFKG